MIHLADLHAPYDQLLRHALALCSASNARLALDIGCGPGLKLPWLAPALAPGGMALGIDSAMRALRSEPVDGAHPPAGPEVTVTEGSAVLLAGDALGLPLRDACADLAWCVAALRLFGDEAAALAEIHRVLRPGGRLVVAVAEQLWVRPRAWPEELMDCFAADDVWSAEETGRRGISFRRAGAGAEAPGIRLAVPDLRPADGLGDALGEQLAAAGFTGVRVFAWLLDPPLDPAAAALALADWVPLRARLAPRLAPALLARCDAAAAASGEPALAPVLLCAAGTR